MTLGLAVAFALTFSIVDAPGGALLSCRQPVGLELRGGLLSKLGGQACGGEFPAGGNDPFATKSFTGLLGASCILGRGMCLGRKMCLGDGGGLWLHLRAFRRGRRGGVGCLRTSLGLRGLPHARRPHEGGRVEGFGGPWVRNTTAIRWASCIWADGAWPCELLRLGAVSGFGNEYYRQKVWREGGKQLSKGHRLLPIRKGVASRFACQDDYGYQGLAQTEFDEDI